MRKRKDKNKTTHLYNILSSCAASKAFHSKARQTRRQCDVDTVGRGSSSTPARLE